MKLAEMTKRETVETYRLELSREHVLQLLRSQGVHVNENTTIEFFDGNESHAMGDAETISVVTRVER